MSIARERGRKAGFNQLNFGANPYHYDGSDARTDWMKGWEEGNEQRRIVRKHEHKLYGRNDLARFEMLWY